MVKINNILLILLFWIGLQVSIASHAAGHEFGGGFAVRTGEKVLKLYDFYEQREDLFFQCDEHINVYNFEPELIVSNRIFSPNMFCFLKKLEKKEPKLALKIAQHLSGILWIFKSGRLKSVEDSGFFDILSESNNFVTLALRDPISKIVYVSEDSFNELSRTDQLGLILHEVVSSILEEESSLRARFFTYAIVKSVIDPNIDIEQTMSIKFPEFKMSEFLELGSLR